MAADFAMFLALPDEARLPSFTMSTIRMGYPSLGDIIWNWLHCYQLISTRRLDPEKEFIKDEGEGSSKCGRKLQEAGRGTEIVTERVWWLYLYG